MGHKQPTRPYMCQPFKIHKTIQGKKYSVTTKREIVERYDVVPGVETSLFLRNFNIKILLTTEVMAFKTKISDSFIKNSFKFD
jgi:hypothetical protein